MTDIDKIRADARFLLLDKDWPDAGRKVLALCDEVEKLRADGQMGESRRQAEWTLALEEYCKLPEAVDPYPVSVAGYIARLQAVVEPARRIVDFSWPVPANAVPFERWRALTEALNALAQPQETDVA